MTASYASGPREPPLRAQTTQTARDDSIEKQVGTVGRVHPHLEVKVVDPSTGLTVPAASPARLCTRGTRSRATFASSTASR